VKKKKKKKKVLINSNLKGSVTFQFFQLNCVFPFPFGIDFNMWEEEKHQEGNSYIPGCWTSNKIYVLVLFSSAMIHRQTNSSLLTWPLSKMLMKNEECHKPNLRVLPLVHLMTYISDQNTISFQML
jgi:hypothetical protein